jgi:hypothetical protein
MNNQEQEQETSKERTIKAGFVNKQRTVKQLRLKEKLNW